jgi:pimeloyl-ACP methyl ester carboxylesterase
MPVTEVRGVELHFTDTGSGPVALFVHGFPLDGTVWTDQVARLGGEDRRCIVPDLAGFGRSAAVATDSLGMERHADDLAGLLDALDVGRVDLVGLSMGGYVALAFAARHPGRLRTLALVDTKATADTAEGKAGRDAAVARLLDGGRAAFAAEMATTLLGPDAGPMLHARVREMIESTRYETIVAALVGLRDRPDRTAVLAESTVPVAVVVGEHDGVTPPAAAEEMAALGDGATLHVVPGSGHLTPIEAPDAVAAALQQVFDRGN